MMQKSLLTILLLVNQLNSSSAYNRSCRRFQRNGGWWDQVWSTYDDIRFKRNLRVSRATFLYILNHIREDIEKDTLTEIPLSPELRLGICLYRLGRGDYLHTISELSGYGISTVCTVVLEVSKAIVNQLWEASVSKHFPKTEEEFKECMITFDEEWQFPCCFGAVDGCHLPIKCPDGGLEACKEYHNFKNFYSIVLIAIVDAKYRFIWASCGFPGNNHDSVIFQSTNLYEQVTEHSLIPAMAKEQDGTDIPPLIIADSAFPLSTWIMKPYGNAVLTQEERYFNYRLSRARMVTEGAYGRLKGRWRILLKKCESKKESLKVMALACIVLHNLCIDLEDTNLGSWDWDLIFDESTKKKETKRRSSRACEDEKL